MATLPEIAEWVNGVYQIEESDPVLGGPPNESTGAGLTNIPALHLAKRTAYLKQVLDDAGIGATAAPAIADFNAVGASGLYQADSAANAPEPGVPFTLMHIQSSATQATQIASRITSDRVWVRRLAAGTWASWREILHTGNAATILGNTPAQFDETTALATTEFVQRALGNHQNVVGIQNATTLTAEFAGSLFSLFGVGSIGVTLPLGSTLAPGSRFTFFCSTSPGQVFITRQGSDEMAVGTSVVTGIDMFGGDHMEVVWTGVQWTVTGSVQLRYQRGFGSSLSASGYQRLPSGLIIQWGTAATVVGATNITFPLAFPSAARSIAGNLINVPPGPNAAFFNFYSLSSATFGVYARKFDNTDYVAAPFSYIAIGY